MHNKFETKKNVNQLIYVGLKTCKQSVRKEK